MSVTCMEENRCLTASLSGELDHHRAREVMEELDRQIDAALPRKLTLDLAGLTFTDSSGIAVVLRHLLVDVRFNGQFRAKHDVVLPDGARLDKLRSYNVALSLGYLF